MKTTELLKHEHQSILLMLEAIEKEVQRIQDNSQLDPQRIERIADFVRNFLDRCHHAKEEDLLFIKTQERGMPTGSGPIAVTLTEHTEGRQHVGAVAEAPPLAANGDAVAFASVRDHLAAYVKLLRTHIHKEDNILYPMADRLLTAEDQQGLLETFEQVENEAIGAGVHERYHQLAHELAGRND